METRRRTQKSLHSSNLSLLSFLWKSNTKAMSGRTRTSYQYRSRSPPWLKSRTRPETQSPSLLLFSLTGAPLFKLESQGGRGRRYGPVANRLDTYAERQPDEEEQSASL
ncbi:hypothetical protein ACLB2K_046670 [Fragaria x ananassa]